MFVHLYVFLKPLPTHCTSVVQSYDATHFPPPPRHVELQPPLERLYLDFHDVVCSLGALLDPVRQGPSPLSFTFHVHDAGTPTFLEQYKSLSFLSRHTDLTSLPPTPPYSDVSLTQPCSPFKTTRYHRPHLLGGFSE